MSSRPGMAWSSEFLMSLKYPGLCSSRLAKSFWAAQRIWEWKKPPQNSVFYRFNHSKVTEMMTECWENEWICDVHLNPREPREWIDKCLCHFQSISSIDFSNHFTGDTLYSLTQLSVENIVSLIKIQLLKRTFLLLIMCFIKDPLKNKRDLFLCTVPVSWGI